MPSHWTATSLAVVLAACGGAPSPATSSDATAASSACPESADAPERLPETPENHRAVALQLLSQMDMDEVMSTAVDALMQNQLDLAPELASIEDILREFVEKHAGWDAVKEDFVEIYVDAFTQRELEDLLAFYATPTGKKSITLAPELVRKGALIGQIRVKEHLPDLMRSIQERIEQQGGAP